MAIDIDLKSFEPSEKIPILSGREQQPDGTVHVNSDVNSNVNSDMNSNVNSNMNIFV